MTQQALAVRLGISASYLNLIEHEQLAITASLLIKLAETLHVDLATLSGAQERQLEAGLREVFADVLLDEPGIGLAGAELAAGPHRVDLHAHPQPTLTVTIGSDVPAWATAHFAAARLVGGRP